MVRSIVRLRWGEGRYETVRRTRVTDGYLWVKEKRRSVTGGHEEIRERGYEVFDTDADQYNGEGEGEWDRDGQGTHHAW